MKKKPVEQPAAPARSLRGSRRWFRCLAVAAPVLIFVFLELALRGIGYGYPTSFILKTQIAGRDVFIENQSFARRYFPPGLERSPQTLVIPAAKTPDAIRVFVFGESAALGDPEPAYSFSRILEVMLQASQPGKKVAVFNVAMTAINSHVIRDIARDCARIALPGDYWIVYMGNNEVVGPFGAGTVFGAQVPSRAAIRANLALKQARVGQSLDAIRWRLAGNTATPSQWEGLEMFLRQQVPAGDPRLARAYENFEGNLRDILDEGRRAGAKVLLATVAVNLQHSAPFASVHRPGLEDNARSTWQRAFDDAHAALLATNAAAALVFLTNAAALDPHHAGARYLSGHANLTLGRTNEARAAFEAALEQDALRFRADARINQILRQTAGSNSARVELVDVAAHLATRSSVGIPGEEFFFEHVHLNFAGNYEIARLLARRLLPDAPEAALPSIERCAAALAHTVFDQYRVLDEVRQRLEFAPFKDQLDHQARAERLRQQMDPLRSASFTEARAVYERAVAARPDDPVLRQNFGTLLKDFDQLEAALVEWKRMVELAPHSADACLGLGDTLDALGRSADAIGWFRRALRLRPDAVETRNGLALALAGAGNTEAAIAELEKALRYRPSFSEARVNLGRMLVSQGRTNEAKEQYLEALRRDSNSIPARINLGKLFTDAGQPAEAAAQYRDAIRIKPDHPVAHFNLGNALSNLGDPAGAWRHFAEAARLNPKFAEARYRLGLELARHGDHSGALAEFTEAVRLSPKHAEAHFNLGVALARAGRFDEAASHFEDTLRLEQSHSQARKFLEQAKARSGR